MYKIFWVVSIFILIFFSTLGAYYKLTLDPIAIAILAPIPTLFIVISGMVQLLGAIGLLVARFFNTANAIVIGHSVFSFFWLIDIEPLAAVIHVLFIGISIALLVLPKPQSRVWTAEQNPENNPEVKINGEDFTVVVSDSGRKLWMDSLSQNEIMDWLDVEQQKPD